MANASREGKQGCRCCVLLPLQKMSECHMVLLQLHKTVYQPHHKVVLLVLVPATAEYHTSAVMKTAIRANG